MTFTFAAYRFFFETIDPVHFAVGGAANAFRGAFGHIFRRIACREDCPGTKLCEWRQQCAYARLFEPVWAEGPSGLADAPRPFVIRASSLDGREYGTDETFWIDVYVFDLRQPVLEYLNASLAVLAEEGIGAARGRVRLKRVVWLNESGQEGPPSPIVLSLDAGFAPAPEVLAVRFLTPTELKSQGRVLADAPFAVLLARARDRVSTLRALYGGGPLEVDFRGIAARAAQAETIESRLEWVKAERRSSRTGQVHSLGGFVGEVAYRGVPAECLPILRAACWTGIGRQTVWGKGEIFLLQFPT